MGRRMLEELLARCGKDTKDLRSSFDDLVDYLLTSDDLDLASELEPKGVRCPGNFYDVALDYIVVDSFEVEQ